MATDNSPDPTVGSDVGDRLSDTIGLDSIPDAVVIADAQTRHIVYANAAANELFDCEPGALIGRVQTGLHPPGNADAYAEAFERGLRGERVDRLRSGDPLFIETAGGDRVPVEITVQTMTVDGTEHLMGLFRESSAQLARERTLERTTGRLKTLLETLPVPVAVLDTDGTVRRWNRAAEETFGYRAEQIVGREYSLLPDADEFASLLDRVTEGEMLEDYRTALRAENGSRVPVEVNLRPIYEDGSVSGVVGTAVDLSDRHQREQQLDVLHRVARHNLRNELTIIGGWAEVLEDTVSESGKAAREIMGASDRLLELSDEIVKLRHTVSEGGHDARPRDIGNVLTTLSTQLRADESVADAELATDVADGQVREKAAEAALELFDNILNCHGSAAIRVDAEVVANHVELSVESDTPLFCSGERVLIQEGTETALGHARGIRIARSYLTLQSVGGAATLEPGPAETPAATLRVDLPQTGATVSSDGHS